MKGVAELFDRFSTVEVLAIINDLFIRIDSITNDLGEKGEEKKRRMRAVVSVVRVCVLCVALCSSVYDDDSLPLHHQRPACVNTFNRMCCAAMCCAVLCCAVLCCAV